MEPVMYKVILFFTAIGSASCVGTEVLCTLCSCKDHLVLCNNRNLTNIPPNICSGNPISLDLSGNLISVISGSPFIKCERLKKLYLNRNTIFAMDHDGFTGLYTLQYLDLSENMIEDDLVEEGVFRNLNELTELKFIRQKKRGIRQSWPVGLPDHVWGDIPKLKSLKMDSWSFTLPKAMATLKSLERLEIYSYSHVVDNTSFAVLNNISLKSLKLDGTNLQKIHHYAFSELDTLEELDLSGHRELGKNNYDNLGDSLYYASHKLTTLVLNATCPNSLRNQVSAMFFYCIGSTYLENLYMDDNQIYRFTDSSFHYGGIPYFRKWLPNLKTLSFGGNDLNMPGLDLSRFRDALGSYKHLKILNVSHQQALPLTPFKRSLDDYYSTVRQQVPPSLEYLYASYFFMGAPKQTYTIHLLSSEPVKLRLVDLSSNRFDKLIGKIDINFSCSPSVVLDISLNDCRLISENFFDYFGHCLKSLKAGKNVLGGQLTARHFQNLTNIIELDLHDNNIENFPFDILKKQKSLEVLDLSRNSLKMFTLEIKHMENLSFINLSTNGLNMLPKPLMDSLGKQHKRAIDTGQSFKLDLSKNPFICGCDFLLFLQWMNEHRTMFVSFNEYYCQDEQMKTIYFKNMKYNILLSLEKKCRSLKWLYISVGLISLLIFLLIIIALAYQRRWEIKYFFLNLNTKRKQYQEICEDNYLYDAFVAYHHEDVLWVKDSLIPNLEEKQKLKLCVHHRDFEAGAPIEENILKSIQTSRKTIVIVSKGFVKSGWCKFELHMARQHWIESGTDRLIIVLLEDVPVKDLPRTMVALFRTHTYLQWSEEAEEQKVFWLQLKRAVNKPVQMELEP